MCTALVMRNLQKQNFFGRTMDFSYDIEPGIYVIPKDYLWHNVFTKKKYCNRYSFIGIGQEKAGVLGLFDGVNEAGFAAAALYFEGYANYDCNCCTDNDEPVASVDFLHFILGNCCCVDDLYKVLKNVHILGLPDPVTQKAAPLHWIATDRNGKCVVIEQTDKGLEILKNPIGVMSNSPDFRWHMTNLKNYIELSAKQSKEAIWGNVHLIPFSQGGGTRLLPGGYTSPDRFVRTAFLKTHCQVPKDADETLMACFNIMGNVTIPKGVVITSRETFDYTKYTAFINTNTCEYFFKTHNNIQVFKVGLKDINIDGQKPILVGNIMRPVQWGRFRLQPGPQGQQESLKKR